MRPALIFALWTFLGVTFVQAASPFTFEALTDRQLYQENSRSQIFVEARIRAAADKAQSDRNIVLVVDRSGSMAGESVQALRAALINALKSLRAGDVVSLVVFGSEVETLIEGQRGDQIRNLEEHISQIEPAGGAALYDALNQGAAQLRRHASPTLINHLILITDGPATKGPRESDDFERLADVFAREGIMLSTIGLGTEFNEDVLAAIARIGQGRFRFVEYPPQMGAALLAEIAPRPTLLARDAVLTFEFRRFAENVQSHGRFDGSLDHTTVTYRFPQLIVDDDLKILASAEIEPAQAQVFLSEVVTVRLRWKSIDSADLQEVSQVLPVHFTHDNGRIRNGIDPTVTRTKAAVLIGEGLQQAIEEMDKGFVRDALRTLRTARSEARNMNFVVDDAAIAADIGQLDMYIKSLQPRDLGPVDRKILRSGLLNRFDLPAPSSKLK
jgi:Ca-activated chloride channel homolog